MMKNIVCSLELSLKLKQIGIEEKSLFAYFKVPPSLDWELQPQTKPNLIGLPAYLAEELAVLLPTKIIKEETIDIHGEKYSINYDYHFKISSYGTSDHWHCSYIGYPILQGFTLSQLGSSSFGEHDLKLADAIAKMIIYLIENGLVKYEQK